MHTTNHVLGAEPLICIVIPTHACALTQTCSHNVETCGIASNKCSVSSWEDLCWEYLGCIVGVYMRFLSSFRCRASGQTSESIAGAALIPNPQAILPAFTCWLLKHRHCLKTPDVCPRVIRTPIWLCFHVYSMYLCEHYLFSHLCLVVFFFLSVWAHCCKLQHGKNNLVIMQDSYLDEKWHIPFEDSADQMLKRKTAHFVGTLRLNTEANQDDICTGRGTHCHCFLIKIIPF